MRRSARYNPLLLVMLTLGVQVLHAQGWRPAMAGLHPNQLLSSNYFNIKFKNNLLGRDWIYGAFLDEDSVRRCVAYREGGRWVPLPVSFTSNNASYVYDLEQYGDTLLMGGQFFGATSDLDSSQSYAPTAFLKWSHDSLWTEARVFSAHDISVSGDSILIWGIYLDAVDTIWGHILSTNGGQTWQYPYSVIHPTEATADFGAIPRLKIHNGQIYTLNNGSSADSAGWKGVIRWDGTQWNAYPYGIWGGLPRSSALEFYQGELYMGGGFTLSSHPNNPGNGIVKWDGAKWVNFGNGVGYFVQELFVYKDLLHCLLGGQGWFADAPIPYFAAWDGHQWCGTPGNYARPPMSYGYANDTLFVTFVEKSTTVNGDTVTHMNFFDGDYLYGPDAICSTYDLEVENEPEILPPLELFPNPTPGALTVRLKTKLEHVELCDFHGRLIREMNGNGLQEELSIDLSDLPSGMYIIKVNNTYHAKVSKL